MFDWHRLNDRWKTGQVTPPISFTPILVYDQSI